MTDAHKNLLGDVPEKEVEAILDRTLGPQKKAPEASGSTALDAALNDPEAGKAIEAVVTATAVTGAGLGFLGGATVGAVFMGIIWAIWPKKSR